MSSESENQTAGQEKKSPLSLEERLLALDAEASKKALHDSRRLKRLGILFYILAVCVLLLEVYFLLLPHLPGYGNLGRSMHVLIREWTIILPSLIVILPAFGFALRKWRSTVAKWLFRIVSILMVVGGVLDMISGVRESKWFEFFGDLVAVVTSIRLCIITYNEILFGTDPPSHNQLGYVRSKWKAGQKPDHIPEHVHKLPKYARTCFCISFLMIPVSIFFTLNGFQKHMIYTGAQSAYEAGQTALAEAGQASTWEKANEKYTRAYVYFRQAASDPKNRDVHVYLGMLAARGLGCAKDEDEAFLQLTMFPDATDSDPSAQYELALLYLYGRGTDRNVAKAARLLQDAARRGHREAKALLGYDMSDLDETGSETGNEASFQAPDYGGKTVEEYLEEKVEKESLVKTGTAAAEPAGK